MKKMIIYIHGKGGNTDEAEHFAPLFPDSEGVGLGYNSETPMEAKHEFPCLFDSITAGSDTVTIIANSIGAYLVMHSLSDKPVSQALFISPIADMENLIGNMMKYEGITEDELFRRKKIVTEGGDVLSWGYLHYIREHPIKWEIPTCILYGENDDLTSIDTITRFAESLSAPLTVMKS